MGEYELTWITDNLAIGHAPMSYADFDTLKDNGIDAIVNLCGEYCDLHDLESGAGFEVYYLPIPDECAPDMAEMEKALNWLDEAIYLGKRVLVHCRFGVGRTGTFVTSYLIRRGMGLKLASKHLKSTRANPTNWNQWRLLKKYGKKSGILKIREPSLENKQVVDLGSYFSEYESLVSEVDAAVLGQGDLNLCGRDTDACCFGYFELELMEAIYLSNQINRSLSSDLRSDVIVSALEVVKHTSRLMGKTGKKTVQGNDELLSLDRMLTLDRVRCPLSRKGRCLIFDHRPIRCRCHGLNPETMEQKLIHDALNRLSRNVFLEFSGSFMGRDPLTFSLSEVASGRFVQKYFNYMSQ